VLTVRTEGESSPAHPAPFKPGAFEPRPGALEPRPGPPLGQRRPPRRPPPRGTPRPIPARPSYRAPRLSNGGAPRRPPLDAAPGLSSLGKFSAGPPPHHRRAPRRSPSTGRRGRLDLASYQSPPARGSAAPTKTGVPPTSDSASQRPRSRQACRSAAQCKAFRWRLGASARRPAHTRTEGESSAAHRAQSPGLSSLGPGLSSLGKAPRPRAGGPRGAHQDQGVPPASDSVPEVILAACRPAEAGRWRRHRRQRQPLEQE